MISAVSELDALAEADPPDADAWERVLVRAISSAASYADLETLCHSESVEDAFLGEGDAPASTAVALFDLAQRLGGDEGARVVAFTVRSTGVDVRTSLAPTLLPTKAQFTAGLESVLPRIRETLAGPGSDLGLLAQLCLLRLAWRSGQPGHRVERELSEGCVSVALYARHPSLKETNNGNRAEDREQAFEECGSRIAHMAFYLLGLWGRE